MEDILHHQVESRSSKKGWSGSLNWWWTDFEKILNLILLTKNGTDPTEMWIEPAKRSRNTGFERDFVLNQQTVGNWSKDGFDIFPVSSYIHLYPSMILQDKQDSNNPCSLHITRHTWQWMGKCHTQVQTDDLGVMQKFYRKRGGIVGCPKMGYPQIIYLYLVVHPTNRKWVSSNPSKKRGLIAPTKIPFITRVITHLLSGI